MEIRWNYNIEKEVDRIIFTASQIHSLFYQKNDFLVLPYPLEDNPRTIYFPDYKYHKINKFWCLFEARDSNSFGGFEIQDFYSKADQELLNQVREQLRNFIEDDILDSKALDGLQAKWVKKEEDFLNLLNAMFDLEDYLIEITPTRFGSMSSYAHTPKEENNNKILTLRIKIDQDISHIAEAILHSLLRKQNKSKMEWLKSEEIVDRLFQTTKLKYIFPGYTPTSDIVKNRKFDKELYKESQNYLSKLGFCLTNSIEIKAGKLVINQKLVQKKDYTEVDLELIKALIANKNNVLTFDQVAQIIWKEEATQKFSLWAIAKRIQKLRDLFEKYGVRYQVLETKRTQGYILHL